MKKILIIITSFLSLFIFLSCFRHPYDGERMLSVYVPTFQSSDLNNVRMHDVLEEDDYGRVLFVCAGSPGIYTEYGYDENDAVVVIMQKEDRNNIYFYEDSFFAIIHDAVDLSSIDVNSQEIVALKEANDWGKELDTGKMSKREINITLLGLGAFLRKPKEIDDLYRYQSAMLRNFQSIQDIPKADAIYYDCDGEKMLFWIYVQGDEGCKNYFCIGTLDNQYSYMEITDIYSYQEDLAEFKKANGWNYG